MKSLLVLFFFLFYISAFSNHKVENKSPKNNSIQLAILLDTSGSMDGLIDQAKSQLWKIVNELSNNKKEWQTGRSLCCTL
jgi:uncharacterized protein with von Willebrand factor type A (vWA) domain